MNSAGTSAPLPIWRNRRLWFLAWLAGTMVLAAVLLRDAWPWLQGAAQAAFRDTRLNQWPLAVCWWLLVPGALWLQNNLTMIDRRWPWTLVLHGLAAAAITGLFIVLQATRMVLANHLPAEFLPVVINDLRWMGGWDYNPALIYLLLVFGLYAFSFYREWRAGQRLTSGLRVVNAQLETRLVRASLDALKMQLHPHFLFNTLNSITGLIRKGRTREAEDIVAGLGELLRRSLDHRQEAMETLEEELVFLRRYFEIESIRFQDRLTVQFDIDQECLPARIPSLILQPLAENAMKHGISKDHRARVLRLSARRGGGDLVLSVYNDGQPLADETPGRTGGIGVQNTRTRLHMLYGDAARFRLFNGPDGGVCAEITLPFQTTKL